MIGEVNLKVQNGRDDLEGLRLFKNVEIQFVSFLMTPYLSGQKSLD